MRIFADRVKRFARDRAGTTAVTFAVASLVALASVAAAVDYSRSIGVRENLQSALDVAVLAGTNDTSDGMSASAKSILETQFEWTAQMPPSSSFDRKADGGVAGQASVDVPLVFAGILGQNVVTVSVVSETSRPGSGNGCILLLGQKKQALLVNGGANINGPDCQIHVKSTQSPAAMINSGISLNVDKVCIAGSNVTVNGTAPKNAKGVDVVSKPCTTVDDPFAGKLPTPASTVCTVNGTTYDKGPLKFSPGVYCGNFNFNVPMDVTFEPGLYVIRGKDPGKTGTWLVNGGTWTGNGVTFYFADASGIQYNSGVTSNLSAPKSGDYAGILFYEATGLPNKNWILNSGANHNLKGLVYLPSRDAIFNGGANGTADEVTMVFNSLIVNSVGWKFKPSTSRSIGVSGGVAGSTSPLFVSR